MIIIILRGLIYCRGDFSSATLFYLNYILTSYEKTYRGETKKKKKKDWAPLLTYKS